MKRARRLLAGAGARLVDGGPQTVGGLGRTVAPGLGGGRRREGRRPGVAGQPGAQRRSRVVARRGPLGRLGEVGELEVPVDALEARSTAQPGVRAGRGDQGGGGAHGARRGDQQGSRGVHGDLFSTTVSPRMIAHGADAGRRDRGPPVAILRRAARVPASACAPFAPRPVGTDGRRRHRLSEGPPECSRTRSC
ncbi:MAG: hypothetical protein AVDCRST_MAG79-754 [uncultured Thermoleophilia bacterium]|uniref:Uncharacterized protein n=1 Tax=uncultured Thermoleophilia bacterium TaxID=1497501 RepID=A0A6J4TPX3_9ACTN|nr:MAG: hypothetical protein AVDCRST_MAG79-754 [uncultured Thermoleophilia bacterium]